MKIALLGLLSAGLITATLEMFVRLEAEKIFGSLMVSLHLKATEQLFFMKGLISEGRQTVSSKGSGDSNSLFGGQDQARFRVDLDNFRELRV